MLYAGLDLSRKRIDYCLLDEEGALRARGASPPDGDGLRSLAQRLAAHAAPITAVSKPCDPGRLCRMAAPAPSPNNTQVLRSVQSTIEDSFSAPMTRTVS